MSSINLSFCIPKKRQTVEPYIVVTDFLKTSEKECTKIDLKNERTYQILLNKATKSQRIIQNSGLSMNLEVPVPPRPSNRDRFILWKKRNISKPVIEQSNAIVFLEKQGLNLDKHYEAYQAIDLAKEIKKEKGIRENYHDKSLDFSKVHTENDTNLLRRRSVYGFNNFRNRSVSNPNPHPYQDVNNLNSFHNTTFEQITQHENNRNFMTNLKIKSRSNSPKETKLVEPSAPIPSAPSNSSINLRSQIEQTLDDAMQNTPKTLYPIIN